MGKPLNYPTNIGVAPVGVNRIGMEVTFNFLRGAMPIIHPADNADPGYPDEIEAIDIKPEFGSLDAREKSEALDWAQSWLDDEGFEAAMDVVLSDDDAAREYAAALRADR